MSEQLVLPFKLQADYIFDSFYCPENSPLVKLLTQFIATNEHWFFYLYGKPASGKTHLLQASYVAATTAQLSAFYLPLRELTQFSSSALENLETFNIVLIDDIDVITGNNEWEEALFHLYNRCQLAETRLILSANNLAKHLNFSLADLSSRLTAGLSIETPVLADDDKRKILTMHADKRGLELNQQVANFLLRRCSRNLDDLLKILQQLDESALVEQRKLTIPFVKQTLGI